MFTWEEDVEIHALKDRGIPISRTSPDTPERTAEPSATISTAPPPGVRTTTIPDPFEKFVDYIRARLLQDPHLVPITLFGGLVELGYLLSYQR